MQVDSKQCQKLHLQRITSVNIDIFQTSTPLSQDSVYKQTLFSKDNVE